MAASARNPSIAFRGARAIFNTIRPFIGEGKDDQGTDEILFGVVAALFLRRRILERLFVGEK
jgi:hypothetical protein